MDGNAESALTPSFFTSSQTDPQFTRPTEDFCPQAGQKSPSNSFRQL